MRGIKKIVKSLKQPGLLIKSVTQTMENENKRTKSRISWYAVR